MKRFTAAALVLSLAGASVAMADGHHDHDGGRDGGREGRDWSAQHRDFRTDTRAPNRGDWRDDHRRVDAGRWQDRRDWQYGRSRDWNDRGGNDRGWNDRYRVEYRRPWGYSDHYWRRGDRLPVAYYAPPYVVGDYSAYQLRAPPYGCHWVRVNNDVVLAAVATGLVLDVVYNAF